MDEKDRSLNDILAQGEYCVLYPQSNVASGGETIEVTDIIHPNVKKLSVETVQSIPGVHTSGVNIMMEHIEASETTVIEVNKSPHVELNYYPGIDHQVNSDNIGLKDLNERTFKIIKERYKFLFGKDKKQEKRIKQLTEENEKLKEELNKIEKSK